MKIKKFMPIIFIILFLIPVNYLSSISFAPVNVQSLSTPNAQASGVTFTYGTGAGPVDLDPANAWDSASNELIQQVCEGLYFYNFSTPNETIIPWLAASMPIISNGGLSYTCNLRTGITFQDGYAFNATSAKWSFDRLFNGFINTGISQFTSLYAAIGGEPIVNNTVANANNSITFNLNYVYAPFLALLTFSGSYIVSPSISLSSYYKTNLLNVGNSADILIGTGPYQYNGYTPDDHVSFTRYSNYWGGPNGIYANSNIQNLVFKIIPDTDTRNQDLLNGTIQMIDSPGADYFNQFNENSSIQLVQGPSSTIIQYIGMNTRVIPVEIRKACSYAFNYSDANDVIMQGKVNRMTSPIPDGIIGSQATNSSLNYPIMNVTYARQLLIDNGYTSFNSMKAWLQDPTNNTAWTNASLYEPLLTYNYTYNVDNKVRQDMGTLLADNLASIGIRLVTAGVTWDDFLGYLYGINGLTQNELNFFFTGWMADYNDPQDYINPLFTPYGGSDSTQLNDTVLNGMMTTALQTINTANRMYIYNQIQTRIVQQLFPEIMVYDPQTWSAWETGVFGVQQNSMGYTLFGPVNYSISLPQSAPSNFQGIGEKNLVNLTWQPPQNPGNFPITGYKIYRSTTQGNEILYKTVGNILNFTDTNVVQNQTYYYEISATNIQGEGPLSTEIQVNVPTVPSVPLNVQLSLGNNQVKINWQTPQENGGTLITGYKVYRGTTQGNEVLIATLGNVTNFIDADVYYGQTYYYEISALNNFFEGPLSTETSITVPTTPSAPLNIQLSLGNNQVKINWQAPLNNGGSSIIKYNIYRGTSQGNEALIAILGNVLNYTDVNIENNQTYYYEISATNAQGEGQLSAQTSIIVPTTPSATLNVQLIVGNNRVEINWQAPQDNGGSIITGYKVYRSTSTGNEALIAILGNVLDYTDMNVENGQTYYYEISAINAQGEGQMSAETSILVPTTPGTPLNVQLIGGADQVEITWQAPQNNGGSTVLGYYLYRSTLQGDKMLIATLGNVLSFTDLNVVLNKTYYYEVSARNNQGEGLLSSEQGITITNTPSEPLNVQIVGGATQVKITWQRPQQNGGLAITGYKIFRGSSSDNLTLIATLGNIFSFIDGGIISNHTYYYQVCALNNDGDGSLSAPLSVLTSTIPSTPLNVRISSENNQVKISWQAPQYIEGVQITGYKIYRGNSSGDEVLIATLGNVLSYTDTNATNGQIYYYQIAAYNAAGESPKTTELGFLQNNTVSSSSPSSKSIPGYNIPTVLILLIASIGVITIIAKKKANIKSKR